MDSIVNNLDTIIEYGSKILEIVGGSAIVSSIFPKASELKDKGKDGLATAKKAINVGIIIYNAIIAIANVFGFNFLAAKNKTANIIKGVSKK